MKNSFIGVISRLETAEERISELKDRSKEMSQDAEKRFLQKKWYISFSFRKTIVQLIYSYKMFEYFHCLSCVLFYYQKKKIWNLRQWSVLYHLKMIWEFYEYYWGINLSWKLKGLFLYFPQLFLLVSTQ